jgi:hypothetical protein
MHDSLELPRTAFFCVFCSTCGLPQRLTWPAQRQQAIPVGEAHLRRGTSGTPHRVTGDVADVVVVTAYIETVAGTAKAARVSIATQEMLLLLFLLLLLLGGIARNNGESSCAGRQLCQCQTSYHLPLRTCVKQWMKHPTMRVLSGDERVVCKRQRDASAPVGILDQAELQVCKNVPVSVKIAPRPIGTHQDSLHHKGERGG